MTDDDDGNDVNDIRSYTVQVNPRDIARAIDGLTTGEAITVGQILKSDFPGRGLGVLIGPEVLLAMMRAEAIKALQALVTVQPDDTRAVLLAQNEVVRYVESCQRIGSFVAVSEEFWRVASEEDQARLRQAMGMEPEGDGAGYET